jgi:hypothetical protein
VRGSSRPTGRLGRPPGCTSSGAGSAHRELPGQPREIKPALDIGGRLIPCGGLNLDPWRRNQFACRGF